MIAGEKLSDEAKLLLRAYAVHVARKDDPNAIIEVSVGDYVDSNGQVERTVHITSHTDSETA